MSRSNKGILDTKTLVASSLLTAISIILTRVFAIMVPLGGLPALRVGFGEIPLMITGILFGPIAGGLAGAASDLIGVLINTQGAFFPGFTLSSILWGVIPGLFYTIIRKTKPKFNFNIINTIVILLLAIGLGNLFITNNILSFEDGKLQLIGEPVYTTLLILAILVVLAFIIIPIIVSRKYKENNKTSVYSIDKIVFTVTISYIIISLGLNTLWLSIMFKKGFMIFLPGRILAGVFVIPINSFIVFILSRFFKFVKK